MPQLSGGGGGDPELCATDEMIPFKDEGDPHKEQIFAELSHSEEEGTWQTSSHPWSRVREQPQQQLDSPKYHKIHIMKNTETIRMMKNIFPLYTEAITHTLVLILISTMFDPGLVRTGPASMGTATYLTDVGGNSSAKSKNQKRQQSTSDEWRYIEASCIIKGPHSGQRRKGAVGASSVLTQSASSPSRRRRDANKRARAKQGTVKHQDLYGKGHPYTGYPGYIMMTNMSNDYMNNGSLSPPMPRTSQRDRLSEAQRLRGALSCPVVACVCTS
ncbi:hypothetical protein WMY93_006903 [Mugilogobius chulae]|uniref:CTNNB1 binding N-teminal domain-containing protein n=1 Tax=Mugilogobius chulae TaxID=88201 RepID=A0AAW0PSH8_9GOBI